MSLPFSPVLAWFLLGIAFFVVELVLPGFIIFFFGIGAWCTALALYLFAPSLTSQLVVFMVTSLIALLALRSYLRTIFHGQANTEEDSVNVVPASATGVVTEDIIPPAEGRIKYGGSFWRAVAGSRIDSGTVVRILERNNLQVKVKALETEGEE